MAATAPAQGAAEELCVTILDYWTNHLTRLAGDVYVDAPSREGHAAASPTKGTIWLSCFVSDDTRRKHILRVCEGVALLNALSELSPALWKLTMGRIWPSFRRRIDSPPSLTGLLESTPHLSLSISIDTIEHVEWISERVFGVEPTSRAYDEDIGAVLHLLRASHVEDGRPLDPAPQIRAHLYLNLDGQSVQDQHRVFRQFVQLAIFHHRLTQQAAAPTTQHTDAHTLRACVQVVGFGVDRATTKIIGFRALEYFCRIAAYGGQIMKLLSLNLEGAARGAATQALQGLFPPTSNVITHYAGVDEIEISSSVPHATMVPLLSALQRCHAVRSISITM